MKINIEDVDDFNQRIISKEVLSIYIRLIPLKKPIAFSEISKEDCFRLFNLMKYICINLYFLMLRWECL